MFRPTKFEEFIGNEDIKERLRLYMSVCKKEKKTLPNVLFVGPAGTGKTTLANIVAKEWGGELFSITGGSLRTQDELMVLMRNIEKAQKKKDVFLMIDEIHELPKATLPEAVWLPLMENYTMYYSIAGYTGTYATIKPHVVTLVMNPFTIMGATTNPEDLSKPLRDRFSILCHMQEYNDVDMGMILAQCAKKEGIGITMEALRDMVTRSRGNPRTGNAMFDLTVMRAKSKTEKIISLKTFKEEMKAQKVDNLGLSIRDREVLQILADNTKPMGASRVANMLLIKPKALMEMHEYYLAKKGLISIDNKGRTITTAGKRHIRNHYF
jgi:Holliday junction DNA helicase RuvB